MNISPSSVSTFRQCPYRWMLQYKKWIKVPSNKYLKNGSFAHEVLRGYAEHLMQKRVKRDVEKMVGIIILNKNRDEYKIIPSDMLDKTISDLKNYIKPGIEFDRIQGTEYSYKHWIQHLSVNITGRMDRIDMVENEKGITVTIIDYKTGKPDSEEKLMKSEGYIFYSWAAKKKIQRANEIWIEFHYLQSGEKIRLKAMDYDKAWKKIEEVSLPIINAKDYPKIETRLCDYCDYRKNGHCIKKAEKKRYEAIIKNGDRFNQEYYDFWDAIPQDQKVKIIMEWGGK